MKVASTGSFSRAAAELGLSAPAVSKSIKRLEESLKVRLLNRNTRTVSLTQEGVVYLQRVTPLLEHLHGAALGLGQTTSEPRGILRVSCTQGFGRQFIAPLAPAFLRAYPDIELDLQLEDKHADLVGDRIDVAIRNGRLSDHEIIARQIAPMQMLVCAAPSYLAQHGVPATPAELANHQCINFRLASTGRPFPWEFEHQGSIFSEFVGGRYTANDPYACAQAAIAGLGLVQLGSYQLIPLIRSGQLVPVLRDYISGSNRGHYACYLSRHQLPMRVRVFIDFLADNLQRDDFILPA